MSPAMLRRLLWGMLGALLVCAACGFALGLTGPGTAARSDSEATIAGALAGPRDSKAALRVLGAAGHWGRYDAPEAAVATPAAPPPPDLEGIARDYRLVGIERGASGPVALLLPSAGAAEVIRLKVGQSLAEGITLGSIDSDSVAFSTTAGTSTLHLYDGTQP